MLDRAQFSVGTALAAATLALACASAPPPPASQADRPPAPNSTPEPGQPEPDAAPADPDEAGLRVTATAYNSLPSQGVGHGRHGAWGDRLKPGMKSIAVSHDLLAMGLTRGSIVRIEGLPGEYVVLDRLPKRWHRRIDIYMGRD